MSRELSSDALKERARRAAEARWGKARVYKRLEVIAAGLRAANPGLTEAQAIARAIHENPKLYGEYVAAASNQPHMSHGEMVEAMEREVTDICKIAGKPGMAAFFIDQRTHPRDVVRYFLALKHEMATK